MFLLTFLSKKREELLIPFLDKEAEWIGLSFKYERNQPAFNLVRDRFTTLWVDKHFQEFLSNEINDAIRQKGLLIFSELLNAKSSNIDDSKIKRALLATKLQILQELLKQEDMNISRLNELQYSYDKDKALFEREFSKYEQELSQK